MNENIEWLIGFVLIFIYTQSRFNTPNSNRSSTTIHRYYFAAIGYFLSLCFLYLLIGGGISVSPKLYELLTKGGAAAAENGERFAGGPLLSALILTTLLPNFPILSKMDKWLKGLFQEIGHIPREARELSGDMRRSPFAVPERNIHEIRQSLSDFPEADICFHPDKSPQFEWNMITSLYLDVKNWSEKKKYSSFSELFKDDFRRIEISYEKLRSKALRCFRWMADYDDVEEISFNPVKECQKDLLERMAVLNKDICNYIARGVLRCELTGKERRTTLEKMGFYEIADDRSPLNAHQVVTIGFIVFLLMFFGNLVLGGNFKAMSKCLFTSTMVATIYGLSILLAIYLKVIWPFADIKRVGQRPVASYFLSGLLAIALSFFISLTFKFAWFQNFLEALDDIKLTYPWFLMSFTVTFSISYLSDNGILAHKPLSSWMRWIEGISCSVVLAVASWVVLLWLSQIPGLPPERIPPLKVVILISWGIGMTVGYAVPHWYRSLPPENSTGEETGDQLNWGTLSKVKG